MLEAVSMIRRNVQLEVHLIDELLDLTRISQGSLDFERVIVDLHEVVCCCETAFANLRDCERVGQ